jgi:hypothetical protein
MADKSPKGLALLLMAKKHPDMKPSDEEDTAMNPANEPGGDSGDAGGNQDLTDAAHDVLVAVRSGNEEALANALEDFVSLCDKSEAPAETAPSEPEGPPEVEGG